MKLGLLPRHGYRFKYSRMRLLRTRIPAAQQSRWHSWAQLSVLGPTAGFPTSAVSTRHLRWASCLPSMARLNGTWGTAPGGIGGDEPLRRGVLPIGVASVRLGDPALGRHADSCAQPCQRNGWDLTTSNLIFLSLRTLLVCGWALSL